MKHSDSRKTKTANRAQRRKDKSKGRAKTIIYKSRRVGPSCWQDTEGKRPALVMPAIPAGREKIGGCDWLDWNELSALGLIVRINAEILHPLGLAIFRDPANGISAGAVIAPDGKWEYAPNVIEGLRVRLSDYSGKHGHF
ncbi:TPA: hypothetical protein NDV73_001665 [Klebsiella pneumoniae]|nr:hypothetical protein [Klebsiella pneumoniae]HCD3709961.1 hypothetical protein [Klebsiella pneumoniae]HCD4732351.1 hypothetical protein [Klebsiella pneumoniae]HCD6571081.1 hypothetical protein [Klebsiella pneumoniae]HCD6825031.1 hypothetical protein [Klebsiella pneumoniae]